MGESLQDLVAKTMKASLAQEQERAAEAGMSLEELDAERRRLNLRKARAHAVVSSGLLVDARDVDRIADSEFEATPAIKHVKAWAESDSPQRILVLCGGLGVGKTFAAGLAIASAGYGSAVKSIELSSRIHPFASDLARGVVTLDLRTPLLVLDDLGTEADPRERRWAEAFAMLVENRQMYGRTLITTNLRRKQIRERYDGRIIERLNASGKAVELAGKSRRKRGGGF